MEYCCENADWMTKLTAASPDLKLRDVAIPGTHDSASSTIQKMQPFAAVGRTQNVPIYDQLQRGARYLDIRVGGGDGPTDICIFHGFLKGGKFSAVLDEITRFVNENPGEFLFLDIVLEYGREMTEQQRVHLFDTIKTACGSNMITTEDKKKWCKYGQVTLGELAEHKKNYFVLVHDRIFGFSHDGVLHDEDHIKEKYGFFRSNRALRNKWHNTRDLDQLLKSNEEDLEEYKGKRNMFHNASYVFTPGVGGPTDILHMLVGLKSLRPVSFARILYKYDVLDDHLRAKADEPFNLVTFDFIDLAPALVCFLIGLNFPSKLEIMEAKVAGGGQDSVDVTEKVKTYIKRANCLYLTNIQQDLALDFAVGDLSITFKFDDESKPQRHDISFDEDTEYLLNRYHHNEGNMCVVD